MSNQQTRKRPSLTTWILISLVAGIVVGLLISAVSPEGSPFDQYVTEGLFYVLGQWFIRLMQMLVIPLVFCSIVCGAAAMADPKLLGKVGIGTLLMYIITTALAVLIAIGLAQLVAPGVGLDLASVIMADTTTASTEVSMAETLINIIPTNIIKAMNNGAMLQIIFFALILGFVLGRLGSKVETVNRFFEQFNTVIDDHDRHHAQGCPYWYLLLDRTHFCQPGYHGHDAHAEVHPHGLWRALHPALHRLRDHLRPVHAPEPFSVLTQDAARHTALLSRPAHRMRPFRSILKRSSVNAALMKR